MKRLLKTLLALAVAASASAAHAATPMVSAGGAHTLALQSDGTVLAWGSNQYGQLGNGQSTFATVPAVVQGLTSVKAIGSGDNHMLAVRQDGTLWAWGANSQGQLGDGTTTNRSTPVQITGIVNVAAVAAGAFHSLALKTDGTVWAWGGGYQGGVVTPAQVPGLSGITAIAAASDHSLALGQGGTVWSFGANNYGQIGDGTTTNRIAPVQVPGLSGVVAVAALDFASLALKSDGTLWAWGLELTPSGQFGPNVLQPTQVTSVSGVSKIAADGYAALLLHADGSVMQIDWNEAPTTVTGVTGVIAVAQGGDQSLLLNSNGTVSAYGSNSYGELGNGSTAFSGSPVAVTGLTNAIALACGVNHSAALTADGSVWTWGSDNSGQLGRGLTLDVSVPAAVQGLNGVVQVSAGGAHSLALKSDGTVWAWGLNVFGQVGDNTMVDRASPVQVTGLTNVTAVAAGLVHSLALKSDGTLWAWGENYYGELGTGNTAYYPVPTQVVGLTNVIAIAADWQSLAVKSDGTVWAWGYNPNGQLGLGTATAAGNQAISTNSRPAQVPGLSNIRSVAAGFFNSFAVGADGSAWGWGSGGITGDGTTTNRLTPVRISGLPKVAAIAAGNDDAIALGTDGTVWGWGLNHFGELGAGAASSNPSPVQIAIANVTQVSAGGSSAGIGSTLPLAAGNFNAFLQQAGTVSMLGLNSVGQFGDGTFAEHTTAALAVNTASNGYLDLNVGQTPTVAAAQAVPFFVVSTGGITSTGATVATSIRYNAADQGKTGSVYITAVVPPGSPLAADFSGVLRKQPASASSFQTIQLTPAGWQPVVNGQLTPYTTGVLGAASAALQILNNTATTNLGGAQFCVGYSTGASASATSRTVATIPVTTAGAAAASSCAMGSAAISPQGGYWWNPAEGGRGYTIEQNGSSGNVFFAMYLYTASGNPVWYAAGPAVMSGSTFSAPLEAFAGGQTLTGSYHPPAQGASPGNVSITFTDASDATLTLPGETIPIMRYAIVPGGLTATPPATQPQAGYWWNPAEGGRGYTIEVQNNTAFIAAYMYDTSGNPVWYAAGPATLTGSNSYVGNWTTYTGGQSLGGTYRAPSGTANAGSLTIQFSSPTAGTLTLPDGRQIPIQRYSF